MLTFSYSVFSQNSF